MNELTQHKIDFWVALIDEFGRRFGLSNRDSYRYINQDGGIQMFLVQSENLVVIMQTLSS